MGKRRGKKGQCVALALLGLLVWAAGADAEVFRGATGTLSTQTGSGVSANSTFQDGMAKLYVEYDYTPGTTVTVQIEQRLPPGTGNFVPVTGSVQTITTDVSVNIEIENPGGEYRTNATTLTGGTLITRYLAVGRR